MAGIWLCVGAGENDPSYIAAMRIWLVLLLTLSFALQGWAAAQSSSAPCPMEAEMAMADTAADQTADGGMSDGCCNDMATFLLTGQACKTGQSCQAPLTALLLSLPEKTTGVAVRQTAPVWQSLAAPSATVAAVWRPPTAH